MQSRHRASRGFSSMDDSTLEVAVRHAAWKWFCGWIANVIHQRLVRRTMRELQALSDRELRDIGLLRADIERKLIRDRKDG